MGLTDEDVPGWAAALGLPGLVDVHVHFLPPRVMTKVRAQFDAAGPLIGREWPLRYRGTDDERVDQLRAMGVLRFSALSYAHRPGMATWLNDWAAGFAARVPEAMLSATFFPEDGVASYVGERLAAGTEVFKVHAQVGGFDLREPVLDPVWGMLADAGTPVVVHAGSAPVPAAHTGPGPLAGVLQRHPTLTAVVAHMGAPEYADFLALAEAHPRVHLDTTMAFTPFFEAGTPYPRDLLPRLVDLGDRVLLGTDFPHIPYAYAHQLEVLDGLGLGVSWLRRVCYENATRLIRRP